jgi:hypothetical protein
MCGIQKQTNGEPRRILHFSFQNYAAAAATTTTTTTTTNNNNNNKKEQEHYFRVGVYMYQNFGHQCVVE